MPAIVKLVLLITDHVPSAFFLKASHATVFGIGVGFWASTGVAATSPHTAIAIA